MVVFSCMGPVLCYGTPYLLLLSFFAFLDDILALFGCTYSCVYQGYLVCSPGVISLQVIQDGIPLLFSTAPVSSGAAMHVFFFLYLLGVFHRNAFFLFFFIVCSALCGHGLDMFQGNELMGEHHRPHNCCIVRLWYVSP